MQNQKEKKIKKKSLKIKKSEDLYQNDNYDEEMKIETTGFIQFNNEDIEMENIPTLEILSYNNIIVKGKKGHMNYSSKHTLSTGTYYFEVNILSMDSKIIQDYVNSKRNDEFSKKYYENITSNIKSYMPNIRLGFVNTNGDVDLTLGADEFSYGYRASDGALINEGEYTFGNANFNQGDCIGLLIHLKPPMPGFLKTTVGLESEKNFECYIKYFKNGEEQPHEFRGLFEGSYRGAVTLYNYAQVQINFGPKFKFFNCEENKSVKLIQE